MEKRKIVYLNVNGGLSGFCIISEVLIRMDIFY